MTTPGIVITFFAALIGAFINLYLFYIKPQISWVPAQNYYQDALVLIIGAVMIRHQLRAVFLDSSAALHIRSRNRKFALWLLMPLGVVGAVFLMAFAFHVIVGAALMLAYTALFMLFWIVLLIGSCIPNATDEEKQKWITAIWGLVVDFAFFFWWLSFFIKVRSGEEGKIEEGNFVFTFLVLIFVAIEIFWIYQESLKERFTQLKAALL